jgi:hypothetical protein
MIWHSQQAPFEHIAIEATLDALHDDVRVFRVLHVVKVSTAHRHVGRALQEPRFHADELVQE